MKNQASPADGIVHPSHAAHRRLAAAARRARDRARGHLTAAIAVTGITVASIAGAAAIAVTLPDPTYTTTQPQESATTHGHATSGHLARPHAPPASGTGTASHTTSGAS